MNTKNSKVESKIPDTSSLVTTTVFNKNICQVDNKNPDHAKYINTQEFNTLTPENVAAWLKQANSESKTYFDNKLISFNIKITSNKT